MKNTYTYRIGDNLYVNLTNRCSNSCVFCVREGRTYEGYDLWLAQEPTAEQVEEEIASFTGSGEVVFCGFGEPTYRLREVLEICDFCHAHGRKTRLNTNGHGELLNGKDIYAAMKGRLDGINISLNAPTEEAYCALCRPRLEGAFGAVIAFGKSCREAGLHAWFSVVDVIGAENVEACRTIAKEVGIPLRVRAEIPVKRTE